MKSQNLVSCSGDTLPCGAMLHQGSFYNLVVQAIINWKSQSCVSVVTGVTTDALTFAALKLYF